MVDYLGLPSIHFHMALLRQCPFLLGLFGAALVGWEGSNRRPPGRGVPCKQVHGSGLLGRRGHLFRTEGWKSSRREGLRRNGRIYYRRFTERSVLRICTLNLPKTLGQRESEGIGWRSCHKPSGLQDALAPQKSPGTCKGSSLALWVRKVVLPIPGFWPR